MSDPLYFRIAGQRVAASSVGTNDGLNYGRFDVPGLDVRSYEVEIELEDLVAAMSTKFDALVAEMRTDDLHDDQPSALMRMGYPTLREAFRHPDELREVIRVYLDREILCTFAPYTPRAFYTVNSTDAITVGESSVTISGRCFARPSSHDE